MESDGIKWHAAAHVDKYSSDQTLFAARWAEKNGVRTVENKHLTDLFTTPEDGFVDSSGNLVTTVGLAVITKLLIGTSLTGSQLSNTYGFNGVGATATAATIADTALGADGGSAFYKAFDSSNPSQSAAVITGISTFGSSQGNFAWNEWCWGTSTVAISSSTGATLASLTSGTETMWNHKIVSLGTKSSGSTWVFTATITLS